jgi:hypothetical protein
LFSKIFIYSKLLQFGFKSFYYTYMSTKVRASIFIQVQKCVHSYLYEYQMCVRSYLYENWMWIYTLIRVPNVHVSTNMSTEGEIILSTRVHPLFLMAFVSLELSVLCFVWAFLSVCAFSFVNCIICSSSIYFQNTTQTIPDWRTPSKTKGELGCSRSRSSFSSPPVLSYVTKHTPG